MKKLSISFENLEKFQFIYFSLLNFKDLFKIKIIEYETMFET